MNKLKKLSLALLASLTLASSASAYDSYKYVNVGVSAATVAEESATGYDLGWGFNSYKDNGFFWGIGFDITLIPLENETVTGFGGDLRLGYTPEFNNHKIAVYGILTGQGQDIYGSQAYGFGYGAGASYRLTSWLETDVEYKTYSMTHEIVDYDSDTVALNLKFTF